MFSKWLMYRSLWIEEIVFFRNLLSGTSSHFSYRSKPTKFPCIWNKIFIFLKREKQEFQWSIFIEINEEHFYWKISRAGEIDQLLRALTILEDSSSIPSTPHASVKLSFFLKYFVDIFQAISIGHIPLFILFPEHNE